MAIPKKLSKKQIEINKNKQKLLNSAGYNVKVDGSWGPWQEQQYNKIMSRGKMFADKRAVDKAAQAKWENDHNKAIAGYYFSDTPTLPNLAKGAYHWLMGNVFSEPENTQYYMTNHGVVSDFIGGPAGAAKTAIKLPTTAKEFVEAIKHLKELRPLRTLIESPFKNVKIPGSSRLPVLHKNAATRTVTKNVGKSQHEVPKDIPENVRGTFNRGYETGFDEGRVQGLQSASNATVGYRQQIADLEAAKAQADEIIKRMTQQIEDLTGQVARANTPVQAAAPVQAAQTASAQVVQAAQAPASTASAANPGKGFWGNLQRGLWETKDNNFGKYYIGRNILRTLSPITIPPILGAGYEYVPKAFRFYGDYAKKSFNFGRGKPAVQDSTRVDSTSRDSSQIVQPTDSQQIQQSQPVLPQARNGVIQAEDMQAVIDSLLEL